ncbi:T-complex protein 11-like protein 1 [Acyrthosiphon pisum]|uniref:T-complex protein 11-like protein 1 n=1 Tax=Acyrthosiphon pisum TaxID=7029 RepID=A0A8R2H5Z8_ACYPI|nr:T-complex protein 11-like protein 1 [Acyrthosiphon pisum]XP_016658959.1 T-complex protein 11-like protein 1 [Acyrthosiphon pisum]XP_016658960.1 T-complex protein 11-like protein 1 [Acyrthosiphon pisum]XP_016658961.1 T-complex protein 11-like protein 1 [Acyrthosiphon pisum]XP_016658962.1 T-complex protein 11-like protein 1 [Acyrthosiphon pisum]XP_016658963.1 T-complex protein 11-like protein 1 [Acyrthosiphon pisum]|eukprot:XP_003243699.1 PREDICTED: T-complex protein 11-like protein 1 [Acyrthosiphon pisum]
MSSEDTSNNDQDNQSTPNRPIPGARQEMLNNITAASPPRFLSLPEIMVAAKQLEDIALVHEIAVNENFKLEPQEHPNNSLMKQVKDTMHKAFWELLREQLNSDPPVYSQAMILLSEIQISLSSLLLDQHTKLKEDIAQVLNVESIQNQIDNDSLDFEYYTKFILNLMSKICAPVRDDSIRALTLLNDPVDIFKGITETLSLMKLDMANFTITAQRRALNACSADYERDKFAEYLKVQPDALNLTAEWLKRHVNFEKTAEPYHDIVARAYMEIFDWNENVIFPEALSLDKDRYLATNKMLNLLILAASTFIVTISTTNSIIPRDINFKNDLKEFILSVIKHNDFNNNVIPNIVKQIALHCNEYICRLNPDGLLVSPDMVNTLETQVLSIQNPDNKIRALVEKRFKEFIAAVISSDNAVPQQCPLGLSAFKDELAAVTGSFLHLITYNRKVFTTFYDEILKNLLKQCDLP